MKLNYIRPSTSDGPEVAVVVSLDDDTLYFLGYGRVGPAQVPPEGLGMLTDALHAANERTPTITMDTGETVYGCECWYGDAAEFDATANESDLESVTVAEMREADLCF